MDYSLYVIFHRTREQWVYVDPRGEYDWTNNPDAATRFTFRAASHVLRRYSSLVRRRLLIRPVVSLPTYNEGLDRGSQA